MTLESYSQRQLTVFVTAFSGFLCHTTSSAISNVEVQFNERYCVVDFGSIIISIWDQNP